MSLLIEIEITLEWENLRKITRWISWVYVRDMLKGFHFVVHMGYNVKINQMKGLK